MKTSQQSTQVWARFQPIPSCWLQGHLVIRCCKETILPMLQSRHSRKNWMEPTKCMWFCHNCHGHGHNTFSVGGGPPTGTCGFEEWRCRKRQQSWNGNCRLATAVSGLRSLRFAEPASSFCTSEFLQRCCILLRLQLHLVLQVFQRLLLLFFPLSNLLLKFLLPLFAKQLFVFKSRSSSYGLLQFNLLFRNSLQCKGFSLGELCRIGAARVPLYFRSSNGVLRVPAEPRLAAQLSKANCFKSWISKELSSQKSQKSKSSFHGGSISPAELCLSIWISGNCCHGSPKWLCKNMCDAWWCYICSNLQISREFDWGCEPPSQVRGAHHSE